MHTTNRTRPEAADTTPKPDLDPKLIRTIRTVFVLSGASALFYQVIWLRLLSTFFGNTTLALSVCLTAFMSGLALGSYLFGRWADRYRRPFRTYALLEIVIGLYGFFSPNLLKLVKAGYIALAGQWALDSLPLVLFQFLACFFVLLIPTSLMGGTLPIMTRGVVKRLENLGRELAWLYGLNTFGAAAGVLLVGFFLLPILGLHASVCLAAITNLAIGLVVVRLDARMQAAPQQEQTQTEVPQSRAVTPPKPLPRALLYILIVGFGLAGFSGLALEVAWARALCVYMGGSVYAFSAVLFAVLVGLALGSVLVTRLFVRYRTSLAWFAVIELAAGFTTLLLTFVYNYLAQVFHLIVTYYNHNYPALLFLEVSVILAFLLLPTVLAGAAFPVLSRLLIQDERRLSRGVGLLYSANTLGCIVGSFAAGFVLIPLIGMRTTVLLCAACYVVTGAAVLMYPRGRTRLAGGAALVALAGALLLTPSWRRDLMSAGMFDASITVSSVLAPSAFTVRYYREGSVCTVSVIRHEDGVMSLRVNAKPDASSSGLDRLTQVMTAHLPMLLADRTDKVLVVGLGCGASAGAATLHPAKRIDCVEIEPAVAEAARLFTNVNHNVFADPRFHLIFADARNYLAASREQYDVITSEPSNPWVAGVASLFTVEHFQACRDRLAEDGIICQWLHLYGMSPDDFLSIVSAFIKVFPDATLWGADTGGSDLVLIAKRHPWKVDFPRLSARMTKFPRVQEDLRAEGLDDPYMFIASLLRGPGDLQRMAAAGQANTDDLPTLEFSAPRNLYRTTGQHENYQVFYQFGAQAVDEFVAFGSLRDVKAREHLADCLLARYAIPAEALPLLPTLPWVRSELRAVVAATPNRPDLLERLASVESMLGDNESARQHLRQALALDPKLTRVRELLQELGG